MKTIRTINDLAALNNVDKCVVKVSAPWCGPCKALKPIVESVEKETGIPFYEVDVDECNEDVVENLKVRGVPVLIFYKNGNEYDRTVGLSLKEDIIQKINAR